MSDVDVNGIRLVVTGKNIEVTPALRNHSEKRVAKILKHFDPERQSVSAEVLLSVERGVHRAEITLQVGRFIARAESRTDDLYHSINEAGDRIERQIRKYKTRLYRRGAQGPKLGELQAAPAAAERAAEEEAEEALPRIVRTKRFALKPMSVDEARLQMELLGHDFFVFANSETEEVNVLYRRRDGTLGLIEPELA